MTIIFRTYRFQNAHFTIQKRDLQDKSGRREDAEYRRINETVYGHEIIITTYYIMPIIVIAVVRLRIRNRTSC